MFARVAHMPPAAMTEGPWWLLTLHCLLLLQGDYSCEAISKVPREQQCSVIRSKCPSGAQPTLRAAVQRVSSCYS